jgi:transposase-like protein
MTDGGDYPTTLLEFEKRLGTDEACREYLMRLRWPEGFQCPRCESIHSWLNARRGLLECTDCHYQVSPTAGTIFDSTRLPLTLWFRAMWLVTSQKSGVSALGLQRQLGMKRYETVWTMLHKLRRAMVRPDRDRLSGRVEVDETYVDAPEEGTRGRQTEAKSLIVVAAQENGRGIGRIRMRRIADASAGRLTPFVEESVEPGSVVHTDAWLGYDRLQSKGYKHQITFLHGNKKTPSELLPGVHLVVSLLKRWLVGTHQGAVSRDHLDYYLDEFTFRFNRRTSRSRGKLFYRLLQQAAQVEPVHWTDVADGKRKHDHNI